MDILKQVLEGREERFRLQEMLLTRGELVLQAALNVPGFPKRIEGDEKLLSLALLFFAKEFGTQGSLGAPLRLENGAGLAFLVVYSDRNPESAKRCAVTIETAHVWGRALDLDVITGGGSISRTDLGLPPRPCLLCEGNAKDCARLGAHDMGDLRKALREMVLQGGC